MSNGTRGKTNGKERTGEFTRGRGPRNYYGTEKD